MSLDHTTNPPFAGELLPANKSGLYLDNDKIDCIAVSGDGTIIMSRTACDGLCRWEAISGQLIDGFTFRQLTGPHFWANDDCTETVDCAHTTMKRWSAAPERVIFRTCKLSFVPDMFIHTIDLNNDAMAVSLTNGVVMVCDIHEQFVVVFAV